MNKSKNIIIFAVLTLILAVISIQTCYADDIEIDIATETDIKNIDTEPDFRVVVDYYAEKIRIINPNSLLGSYSAYDYIEISDNESVISWAAGIGKSDLAENISVAHGGEYMYALKVVSDEVLDSYVKSGKPGRKISALMKEKWYPVYGGGIDIKSIIPVKAAKDPKKQYYIAIRKAGDYFDTENGYESRITVCIKPRYNEKNFSKFIEYDAVNEKIVLSQSYPDGDFMNIIYKYDYFDALSGTLTKDGSDSDGNINIPGKIFSLGGHVYISSLPVTADGQYGPEVTFARSKEIKFKIPKVPAVPALRADSLNKKINAIKKDALEWSLTGSFDSWHMYEKSDTILNYSDIFDTFDGIDENNIDNDGNYIIYFRTKPVDKKSPASFAKKILIPAELCD